MTPSRGYTLLELSIALVIIGLLVGGVLTGKNLIESAKVTNTISKATEFKNAVMAFRTQYKEFPGDMPTATSIWGAADGGDGQGTDCRDVVSTTKATCNGDGNGNVARLHTDSGTSSYERLRLWQHLSSAGYITGQYSGTLNADGEIEGGVNVPEAPLTGVIYDMYSQHITDGAIFGRRGLYLKIATPNGFDAFGAAFTTEQARGIESKYDDGSPDSGQMVVLDGYDTGGCVSNGTDYTTTTAFLAGNVKGCRIFLWVE